MTPTAIIQLGCNVLYKMADDLSKVLISENVALFSPFYYFHCLRYRESCDFVNRQVVNTVATYYNQVNK